MTDEDADVVEPRVRLRRVLAFMRMLAGHRGHAAVTWHGAGFTYRMSVVREDGDDGAFDVDADPTAPGLDELLERAYNRLHVQP